MTSLHVQVLVVLRQRVETRRQEHLEKAGGGLDAQEYQRHVGRIKEATAVLEQIDQLLKVDITELEELQDKLNDERENRDRRRATRHAVRDR